MKKRRGLAARGPSRKPNSHALRAAFERFEDRVLLATVFTVTNITDNPATVKPNDGTLRGALLAANANTMGLPNQIVFNLPGMGVQTIAPRSPLPAITTQTIIDGTTATAQGFDPLNPRPFIDISGNQTGGTGLVVNAAGSTIRDLIINNFSGDGIDLNGGNDTVDGCWIGIDVGGGGIAGNTGQGILVASSNNTIGDLTTNPNVISGNATGIQVRGNSNLIIANLIQHNYIGTDATGTIGLGNTFAGIEDDQAGTTIGGVAANGPAGLGNLISGNGQRGIVITASASNTPVVDGNYIGTDLTGKSAIPNGLAGIYVSGVTNVTIGDIIPGSGNVISGNNGYGVQIVNPTTQLIRLQGNFIGVGADGIVPLGNVNAGVLIDSASFVTVGGTSLIPNDPANSAFGNIIANNGAGQLNGYGVEVLSGVSDGILTNSIYGNGSLGIKLVSGGNQGIAPPTLTSVSTAGQTRITGTYAGIPNTSYRIQFFSNAVPNSSGAGDGQTFLGEIDVRTNNLGNASFTTTLGVGIAVGSEVSSTATQQVLQIDNTSQFSQNVAATLAASTDLAVSTSPVSPLTPLLNQPFMFTITVSNNGPDPSTGVILTDTIPTNSAFVSSSAGTFSNGALTDAIGTLAAGQQVVVTITVNPISTAGAFTNTAFVTGDALETQPLNNTSTTTGSVANSADLTVVLTPSATIVPVGTPFTYILTVGNNGPSTTNDTTVTVNLPSSYTNITVSPDQGPFTIDAFNNVTIDTGILPSSSSSTITITATPLATGTQNVTATVMSSTEDPHPDNNSVTVPVVVANAADLALGVVADPDPVLIGQDLIYTLVVTNNGPSAATATTISDTLPTSVIFDPNNSSAGPGVPLVLSNGVVTASLPQIDPGASYTVTIAVLPQTSGLINNLATVGDPNELDPDLSNNTVSTSTQVSPADVGVTVINPSGPLFIGNQAVYLIQVTNAGPASAGNVTVVDTFSAGATILNASVGFVSGNTVVANLGTLVSGASTTITIAVDPTASTTLINSAVVNSDQYDPDQNNNTSSSSNLVSPVDLSVAVTGSPNPVLTGHLLGYVVTVTNNGPAEATNVLFTDTLPAGSVFSSVTSSQGSVAPSSSTTLSGNLLSLAPGASATVTIFVTPSTVATAVNTATVTSDNVDTNTGNNTASGSVSVINLPGAIQLDSSLYVVPENGGSVTLTLDRTGGSLGTVTVDYATSDFTAVSGVNYVASSGTVTFLDGQLTATITIPVLDDFIINGNTGFFVTLSNPAGGASLGTPDVSAVIVANTDKDTIPPIVTGIIAIPNGSSINGFIITFDEPMDAARASLVSNYHLYQTNGGSGQTPIPLASAVYDPASNSVKLIPAASLPSNRFYHVIANGSFGPALTDTSGNVLYGSSGPGTNYDVFYGQGTHLTYNDAQNNSVTINLSGGGTLAIFLGANGDAATINLLGIVPHKSKLTGTVKKLSSKGSGHTFIGTINGFGQFGNVNSTLTTPSFYVGSAPVSSASVNVSALSVPVTKVVSHKKTPKGPHGHKK